MKRSEFLKLLLASGTLLTAPFISLAVEDKLTNVLLYRRYVAGFQYAEGLKVIDQMKEGDDLHLVREPENPHDNTAVAVYWNQHRIGYVPAIDNQIPNDFILKGLALRARVDKLNKEAKPWNMCKAGIYLLYPKALIQKNLNKNNAVAIKSNKVKPTIPA